MRNKRLICCLARNNNISMSNIEKSITVFTEVTTKTKNFAQNKVYPGNTVEHADKLQIPRKSSLRQAVSSSSRTHQVIYDYNDSVLINFEVKSENPEAKIKKILTMNHSLTPSSDQSSVPHSFIIKILTLEASEGR